MFPLTRRTRSINIWPGFVDALASVLLVFIFMMLFFVIAQFTLAGVLAGREAALALLTRNIEELAKILSLEQTKTSDLEQTVADLEAELRASLAEKDDLSARLLLTTGRAEEAEGKVEDLSQQLIQAQKLITADKETIRLKLLEIASLQQDIAALRRMREQLEAEVGNMSSRLESQLATLGEERDRRKQLLAELSSAEERTLLAQAEIGEQDIRIADLSARIEEQDRVLAEERQLSEGHKSTIRMLNQQISALREQLSALSAALDLAKAESDQQKVQIDTLGKRLNLALARKVEELNRYRSDFFGRLREILGDREDVHIVGDRFVFQSEVLFASASADLGKAGQQQLTKLAASLKEVSQKIPTDMDWVLRIDGHTDRRFINTPQFPSNWELSTARAISIVRYLVDQGIPPQRLIAAGFGPNRPLDPSDNAEAWRRNRRIEIKMTLP